MKMIKFTAPSGLPVWVAPLWVTGVRSALPAEHTGATMIEMGGRLQVVMERPEDVVRALEQNERA